MNFPIGLQLYSVRDDLEKDFEGTLRKVKALGYDAVEFAGLFGHGAEEVRNLCKEIGLIPLSAHVPFVDMMNDPDGVLKVYADIGCKFVVIPYLTEEYRPGQPKFQEVIDGAKLLGKKAKELGMQLCYHNHDFEFVKLNGEYALDILYKEVPADILETGITLAGGGAMLHGMDKLVAQQTGMPVFIAEEPLDCVARGTGAILESPETFSRTLFFDNRPSR